MKYKKKKKKNKKVLVQKRTLDGDTKYARMFYSLIDW